MDNTTNFNSNLDMSEKMSLKNLQIATGIVHFDFSFLSEETKNSISKSVEAIKNWEESISSGILNIE